MTLYKYLHPERVDVLKHRRIRFTQPGDLNDPFEFRPEIQQVASNDEVRTYVEDNYEKLIEEEVAKYGALTGLPSADLKDLLMKQKHLLPTLFNLLEPTTLKQISPVIDGLLNQNIGILCLSEVRDSMLMWGHYANNHQGLVIGFDSEHPFFSKRRGNDDEFGFLRQVDYTSTRPQVTLADTRSAEWFSTKSDPWAYEKEWRIARTLSEADHCVDMLPFPISLFEFAEDAVLEVIVGLRSAPSLLDEVRLVATGLPKAQLFTATEGSGYSLLINPIH